jgi:hypothetical protein
LTAPELNDPAGFRFADTDFLQDGKRVRQKRFPQKGEPGCPRQPMKQLSPQFVFQLTNLLRQGRLRYMLRLGCVSESTLLYNGAKISKLMNFHGCAPGLNKPA